jgi:hypothetical protein
MLCHENKHIYIHTPGTGVRASAMFAKHAVAKLPVGCVKEHNDRVRWSRIDDFL